MNSIVALTCWIVTWTCISCVLYLFHKWASELETIRKILEGEFKSDRK